MNTILANLVEQYSCIVALIVAVYNSILQLMSSSHTIIANNRALEYGGGIDISEKRNSIFCFYQIQDINNDPHGFIEMKNNHADVAGDDIYGVSTMPCQLYGNGTHAKNILNNIPFNSVFKGLYSTLSSVSSTPYRVCFCNIGFDSPKKYCLDTVERSAFLGQEFNVSAIAVGNYRGAAPATVQTHIWGIHGAWNTTTGAKARTHMW